MSRLEQVNALVREEVSETLVKVETLCLKYSTHPDWHSKNWYQRGIDQAHLALQVRPQEELSWMSVLELCRVAQSVSSDLWFLEEFAKGGTQ
jgi:hypothetical protein